MLLGIQLHETMDAHCKFYLNMIYLFITSRKSHCHDLENFLILVTH